MKHVSIIAATIVGNRGAEAMLTATIGRIKDQYPDTRFYVYSYYPEDDKAVVNDKQVTIYNSTPAYLVSVLYPLSLLRSVLNLFCLRFFNSLFPKSVLDLERSDVLIDLAGVSFMDGRAIFLPFNILTIWPAMLLKTPVIKFAQGLGTFNESIVKVTSTLFLSRCKQIFARGEITQKYLETLLPQSDNYQLAADVAFLHQRGDSLSDENSEYVQKVAEKLDFLKNQQKEIIGICPSSVVHVKSQKSGIDYIGTLVKAIQKTLENQNHVVLLFPNATRDNEMEKFRNNDLPLILEIQKQLVALGVNPDHIIAIDKNVNTDSIKEMITFCDITVVSRFHAMIASLSLSTPVMVVGWSHKYVEVMKQFEMSEWVFDYQDSQVDLSHNILGLLSNKEGFKVKIDTNLVNVKNESMKQFTYLFKEILH